MSLEQIVQILDNTLSSNDQVRRTAEATLEQAKQSNFGQLLQTLAVVLESENAPVTATSRQVAAAYIRNSLTGRSQQFKDAVEASWNGLDAKVRDSVKSHVLNSLMAKDPQVSKAAAQTLARIALLELPAGRWPDLIPNLCAACALTNPDQLREAALLTLGFICEDIDEAAITDKIPAILTVVIENMSPKVPSNSVRLRALEALSNMVFFLSPVFDDKQKRDYLMGILLQNCSHSDDEVKKTGFTVLTDIISGYYGYITDYMQVIAMNLTFPMIERCDDDDDDVVKQAIEVWITIADIETEKAINEEEAAADGTVIEDIDKSRRYIEGAMMPLLKSLFVALTKQDPDSEDDEWTVSHAAATCISYAAGCVREKIIPPILQLFQTNIMNPDWRVRNAATVAFGSVLEGPPTDALKPYLSDSKLLGLFLDHMKDADLVVRSSTAWTLGRMCELHVGIVVTDQQRFVALYQAFKAGLTDEPRMASMCCWCLMVLAEALDDFIKESSQSVPNPLAQYFSELVVLLFQVAEKAGCPTRQRKGAYQALGALVHCSTPECIPFVGKVTVMCLDRIEAMTAATSFPDKKDADELEALVSGLMTECVSKLEDKVAEIADRVCTAYLTLYTKAAGASAQEEAVLGLGTFSMAIGSKVERYAEPICKVLQECISKPNEVDVCKAAIGSLGDVCRSMEDKFGPTVPVFVPLLFKLLTTPEVDRSLFSHVMSTLGDIAQFATNQFKPYLAQVIGVVQQAMACKVDLNDEDDRDFLFELQESCFACIAGIQSGLTTIQQNMYILQFSLGITDCINIAYNNMDRPEGLSNAIVGAICDLVIAAGPKTREVIAPSKPWARFPEMITTILSNAHDVMTRETCKLAMERIQQNLQS